MYIPSFCANFSLFFFFFPGLRVKVDSPYLRSWRDTASTKPVDTSVIFDMIVAYNSNFNGHDQQVGLLSSFLE
jgi:hypothetical protein